MLPLSSAARCWLLGLARRSIEAASRGESPPAPQLPADLDTSDREELQRRRAAFVTLHKQGRLRGCVGRITADTPLRLLVPEMAQAAAREDIRFDPVRLDEIPEIQLEISVLSAFFPIRPEEIIPGQHGLFVHRGFQRGLLLPQVASIYHWDSLRFLSEACRKAGLPPDAWKRGVTLEAFLADIIAETETVSASP